MNGFKATKIQHEMHPLVGIWIIDHLNQLKRDMVLKKINKLRKAA